MGPCVAYNCTNAPCKKIPGITFHRFPKDEHQRKLWVLAVCRENWKPTEHSRLCSEHFSEQVIDRTSVCCVRLREKAVPTIFDFPPSFLKATRIKSLRKQVSETVNMIAPSSQNCTLSIKEEPILLHDSTSNMSSPSKPCNKSENSQIQTPDFENGISAIKEEFILPHDSTPSSKFPSELYSNPETDQTLTPVFKNHINGELTLPYDSASDLNSSSNLMEFYLKRKLDKLNDIIKLKNKKIKTLQQTVRRYRQRVTKLAGFVAYSKNVKSENLGVLQAASDVYTSDEEL